MPITNVASYKDERVELAAQGSIEAFEQLVREHQSLVRSFLVRFTDCVETADDLAQEVFVVAYQQLGDFKSSSRFSTWLLGIARNKALNYLRGEVRRRKHEKRFFDMELARRQILKLETESEESTEELVSALKECLQSLPESAHQLVEAFYYQNQSALKIASESQKKSGAIRMKLLRIRASLQKCIGRKTGTASPQAGN